MNKHDSWTDEQIIVEAKMIDKWERAGTTNYTADWRHHDTLVLRGNMNANERRERRLAFQKRKADEKAMMALLGSFGVQQKPDSTADDASPTGVA